MTTKTLQFDSRTLRRLGLKLPQEHEEALLRLLQNELNSRRVLCPREELFETICEELRSCREEILAISGVRFTIGFAPKDVKLSAVLPLGRYPQSRSTPAPIQWRVIELRRQNALLLAEKALDCVLQNTGADGADWDACTLRTWLNGTFLEQAFRPHEQALLEPAALSTPIWGGKDALRTLDRVFCLAKEEVELLLHDDAVRTASPTEYALARGVYAAGEGKRCRWWLRTTNRRHMPCAISPDGTPQSSSASAAEHDDVAVRPAILLRLGAPLRKAAPPRRLPAPDF